MLPVFFTIGELQVSGYWVMTVLGLATAASYMALTNRTRRLEFISWYDFTMLCCFAILSIFVGGKILGILVQIPKVAGSWHQYAGDFAGLWRTLTSGRAFYGGLVMLLLVFVWYAKKRKLPTQTLWALFAPAIPLFMVFGRLGCFMAGCCYGKEVPWGIVFPPDSLAVQGVALFPSQLAEAAGQLILFVFLALAERRIQQKQFLILWYLGSFAVLRFVLEFFRGDTARGIWLLSTSQWISIVIFAAVIVICGTRLYKNKGTECYQ